MVSPVYKAWTKAIESDGGPPRYGAEWISATRGWFKVFPDHIECGDILIEVGEVQDAVLYRARQWLIPFDILDVSTERGHWQFGFNPWANVAAYLPFPFRKERVRMRYSAFSIAVRVIVLTYLIFIIVRRLSGW